MKAFSIKETALAIAIGLMFANAHATEDDGGKRIDHARVDVHAVPPPAEIEPDHSYPLPSGVSRADAQAMREAAGKLPTAAAQATQTLSDTLANGAFFASGSARLTAAANRGLTAFAAPFKGKPGLKLSVLGHTDDQRLSPRSRKTFGDNQGLSEARAMAVAAFLRGELDLPAAAVAVAGKGDSAPVASNSTAAGMAQNRRVEVQVWFDVIAEPEPPPAAPRASCAALPAAAAELPFRVTVDGEPLAIDESPLEADRQRCTDVALEKADIQVRYDSLAMSPALNVWATPNGVERGQPVEFRAWSNYLPWIRKAEIRIFRPGQRVQENPLLIVPVNWSRASQWQVPAETRDEQLFYLLRVYDGDGHFDESSLKPLTLLAREKPLADLEALERERLAGYGENSLALRNIPVSGGTVTVNGSNLAPGQSVEALGLALPVDPAGKFAIKQILPAGPNSVEVKLMNPDGTTTSFRRNLTIPHDDWFYVAIGDLTVGKNKVSGPARLLTTDTQHYEDKVYVDGRGAFYLKGKIKGDWLLTASADTREQSIRDLFSNFSSKDPRYLLRNINPDLYYPVYGDDSTTVDDAPTQGKFYVRLEKGDSHVLWGNFQTAWSGSELLQYSRGLYGAKLRYRSEEATGYGEKRTIIDAFAADPGTLGARDEFRGTGGSLYYLRHQDVTVGSERVWVEVRDRDSGLVSERKQLVPAQDYDINYLQGRIILREPLASTGSASSLVMTSSLNGNALYLVSTYEYVPGLVEVSSLATGVHASQWVNDHLQLGVTTFHQGESGSSQTLKGLDATLRYKPGTWLKIEAARSNGAGSGSVTSLDGGFGFSQQQVATVQNAGARRIETAADLAEIVDGGEGKLSAYWQERDRGYSGPGQIGINGEAVKQHGVKGSVQVRQGTTLEVKADARTADSQDASNGEFGVRQRIDEQWEAGVGVRHDRRDTHQPLSIASPTLAQNGGRTDVVVRLDYKPRKPDGQPGEPDDWEAYGFVQGTAARSGDRDANNRAGVGGGWRVNDRLKMLAEASDGNLGLGGKLGADYRLSDRSNAYLTYAMETDNPNNAYRGRQGTWVTGSSMRVSDELRVFGETRATNGAGPQSLTQAFGLDLAPNDRWNYGVKAEFGTLSDPLAGDLERKALGVSAGYKFERIKYSGSLEWRNEDGKVNTALGNVSNHRDVWLLRNTLGYIASPDWRLIGKANISRSSNSQGAFYDGDFHEFVVGAAYRPVSNDRWNALFKYTNFYNLPSPGQLVPSGATADYAQKSQVFSIDTIYDLLPWLSIGAKYGLRVGELRQNKASGDWFSSRADLLVLRTDWHFVKEWDAVVEARNLRAQEAQDAKSGFLVAVYRHLVEGVKVGVGYNFTRYSDDLTDLSYRSRGWFLNVIGSM
jgi:outer membrane protein OmpA-like peptidoglycan-associated protein